MPAQKKLYELAVMDGSAKVHKKRHPKVAKNENPLGEPPEYMTPEAAERWRELEELSIPGALTAADRPIVELTATLWALFREDPTGMQTAKITQLAQMLGRLGMSPQDRNKLGVSPNNNKKNKFASLDD
jgi:phage terminase small subunit